MMACALMEAHELVDEARLHAPQVARQSRQRAGQREGRQLVAEGAEAHGAHAVLVHADAGQRPAEGAEQQAPQER